MSGIQIHRAPTSPEEFAGVSACDLIMQKLFEASIHDRDWRRVPRSTHFERLETVVGNTGLELIDYLQDDHPYGVYSKLEYTNPSGSHYDRAFLATIKNFEQSGFIRPGDELRDITSGSGGISLAVMAWALSYKARITVPSELPKVRLLPMEKFGAEIIDAGSGYMQQASSFQSAEIAALKADPSWQLSRPADSDQRAFLFEKGDRRICYLNHSENRLSPEAFKSIGHELVAKLAAPQAVILAIGNWTTIAGISPVLREAWPDTQLVGYKGENTATHNNFGTAVDGIPLRFRDESLLDQIVVVSDKQRDIVDQKFNRNLYLFHQVGHSSLMGIAAIEQIEPKQTGSIITIAYDQKIRY